MYGNKASSGKYSRSCKIPLEKIYILFHLKIQRVKIFMITLLRCIFIFLWLKARLFRCFEISLIQMNDEFQGTDAKVCYYKASIINLRPSSRRWPADLLSKTCNPHKQSEIHINKILRCA